MDRGMVVFGIIALIIGVGTGYFMYTYPEGLNPDWPLGMALLAPALFILAGLHLIAAGLQKTHLSNVMLRAILFCFWAVVHWAAFFTTRVQCLVTVSFLGAAVFGWQPSEMECRNSLRAIVLIIDALVVLAVGAFAWQRRRASHKEPGRSR